MRVASLIELEITLHCRLGKREVRYTAKQRPRFAKSFYLSVGLQQVTHDVILR